MEVGKFYRGKYTHSIIVCTGLNKDGVNFSGTTIEIGDSSNIDSMNYVGATSDYLACASFEECAFKPNLESNSSYNIPDGCTATIKENKVVIEDKIEYYKSCLASSTIVYTRIKKRDIVNVRFYPDGDIDILFRKDRYANDNDDLGERISEDVFTKEYNKALNKMKL